MKLPDCLSDKVQILFYVIQDLLFIVIISDTSSLHYRTYASALWKDLPLPKCVMLIHTSMLLYIFSFMEM